jgi:CRP-like cAMP-binding protein
MNQLSDITFFKQLEKESDKQTVLKCLRQLQYKEYVKDDVIFKRGDRGDHFYIILRGKISLYIPQTGQSGTPPQKAKRKDQTQQFLVDMVRINQLTDGQSFGELALVRETPRMATVVCETDCQMATLSKMDYKMVIAVRA